MEKVAFLCTIIGCILLKEHVSASAESPYPQVMDNLSESQPLQYEDAVTRHNVKRNSSDLSATKRKGIKHELLPSSVPGRKNLPSDHLTPFRTITRTKIPSSNVRKERGVYDEGGVGYGSYGEDDVNKHLGHKNHEEYGHKAYGGHKNHGELSKGAYGHGSEYGKKHGYSKGYSKGYEHKYDHQYGHDFGQHRHHGHKDHNYHDYGHENQNYGKGLHHQHAGYGNRGQSLHQNHGYRIYPSYGFTGYNAFPVRYHRNYHDGMHGLLGLHGGMFGGLRGYHGHGWPSPFNHRGFGSRGYFPFSIY